MLNQDIETDREERPPERPKDAWFDHWMCAKGEPLVRLVGEPLSYFASREQRVRKRTRGAQVRFEEAVEALVCNLAYAVLKPSDTGAITVPLSKPCLTKPLRQSGCDTGDDRNPGRYPGAQDFFTVTKGTLKSVSTVKPSDWFKGRLADRGVTLADFGRHKSEELVILSETTKDFRSNAAGYRCSSKRSEWIDYEDTTRDECHPDTRKPSERRAHRKPISGSSRTERARH